MVSALRNKNGSSSARKILGTPWNGLLAEQIAAETEFGDFDHGALYNEAILPEHAGRRLSMYVTSKPAGGFLRVEENGAITAYGFADGTYVVPYDFKLDGEYQGATSFTLNVGIVDAVVSGGVGVGSGAGVGGDAVGEVAGSATVSGGTGTGTGAGAGGDADGQIFADVAGGTGSGSGSGTGGAVGVSGFTVRRSMVSTMSNRIMGDSTITRRATRSSTLAGRATLNSTIRGE